MGERETRRAAWGLALCLAGCADAGTPEAIAVHAGALVETDVADADALFAATPPVIDGLTSMNEVWREAPFGALHTQIAGAPPGPGQTPSIWRAAWDASALYVMVTVRDPKRLADSALPWEDDSVEIYVDADDAKGARYDADDFQLVFRWGDERVVEAHGKSVAGVTFAQQALGGEYQMEIRIPWKSLNADAALDFRRIGFDVQVNDDDDGGARDRKWAWHATADRAWTDPRTFGTLRLLHERLPVCTARDSDDPFGIQRAPATPVIDAREDPSGAYGWAWTGYVTAAIGGSVSGLDDLRGSWKLVWDERYLYLLAFVADDVLRNESPKPWDDDSVELYIDADESRASTYTRDDYQLVFGWKDRTVVEGHGKSTRGIVFETATVAGGYRLEARIPWATLNATPAKLGRRIGFDVHVNDDDDGGARDGKLSWYASEDRAWQDPSGFGSGQLVRCAH